MREAEGAEYGACRFQLDGCAVVYRVAKTTPAKVGQFVTLWKRPYPGAEIAPLAADDALDVVVVRASSGQQHGHFIFSKRILTDQGVFSSPAHAGKRAMRVYPPWSDPVTAQARKTQQWQCDYFLHCLPDGSADRAHAKRLFAGAAGR